VALLVVTLFFHLLPQQVEAVVELVRQVLEPKGLAVMAALVAEEHTFPQVVQVHLGKVSLVVLALTSPAAAVVQVVLALATPEITMVLVAAQAFALVLRAQECFTQVVVQALVMGRLAHTRKD
jgi:phosphoribosylformylglycinamidine (FGAM) synthase PurS component